MTEFQDNIRLSSDIFSFLQKVQHGEVLLITSKSVYLQFSSRILLLVDKVYGITPIGIGLEHFVDFVTLIKPKAGQKVCVTEDGIDFPGGKITAIYDIVEAELFAEYPEKDRSELYANALLERCSSRSLALLGTPLLLQQPLAVTAQMNPYCLRALPILERLLSAIADADAACIQEYVRQSLGFGVGLTPSMDDVLLGLIYGLLRWIPNDGATAALRDAIIAHAQTATNEISAAYLIAVARGAYFERLDDILAGLCSETPIEIEPILEIGSSSGSEMLFGLLLAAKIIIER